MTTIRNGLWTLTTVATLLVFGCGNDDARIEDLVGQHMVGEALLAAHFIAVAEQAGMDAEAINEVLRDVVARSAIDEFWITDSEGHAYLSSTGIDFTFSPDASAEPQASSFWSLIDGSAKIVVQEARVREIDRRTFKYVGVAGIDGPRIVQVGVSAESLTGAPKTGR